MIATRLALSGSAPPTGTLSLTLGDVLVPGQNELIGLDRIDLSVTGGTAPVVFTIANLDQGRYADVTNGTTTPGVLKVTVPPNTTFPIEFGDGDGEAVIGVNQITISATAGSGQTAAVLVQARSR